MSDSKDRRVYIRFQVPVVIDAPDVSDLPLVPEDMSEGGFKVLVSKKPEMGPLVPCDIQICDEVFERCEGQVVWVQENSTHPDTWFIGLTVKTAGDDRGRLVRSLEELSAQMGESGAAVE